LHLIDTSTDGSHFRPFVYGYKATLSPESGKKIYEVDPNVKNYIRFFGPADKPYKLLAIIPMSIRLIAPQNYDVPFFLLGSDRQGRDLFSRLLSGARVSLTIGLVGVFLSLILGVIIGGISGYFGGSVDNVIQRFIELMRSLPTVPLWLSFSVAIPKDWDPLTVYFAISVILSFITWTGMARAVRGRFLALKSQDFIAAAKLDGAGPMRIVGKHMTPLFVSHIIAEMTLSIPTMILGETALSFLGLGLQPPVESWGVLLQQAKSVTVLASAPWLLLPGLLIVVTVLAMNFLGDGLRDAADPYRT
jgi:peptide/nickel transport system permease protein